MLRLFQSYYWKPCPQSTQNMFHFHISWNILFLPTFAFNMTVNTGIHLPKVLFSHWETSPFLVHFLLYVVTFESYNNWEAWSSPLSLLDNNECGSQPSLCGAKGICQNTPGSFSCECQRGFSLDATGLNCEGEFICSKTLSHIQHAVFFFLLSHWIRNVDHFKRRKIYFKI